MSDLRVNGLHSENIDDVCRLCLARDQDNIHIFSEVGQSYKLQDKLYKQFNFWVKPKERIPKTVCKTCLTQVEHFHNYAMKVDAVQKRLEKLSQEDCCCVEILESNIECNHTSSKRLVITPKPSTVFPTDLSEGLKLGYHSRNTSLQTVPKQLVPVVETSSSRCQQTALEIEVEVDVPLHNYGEDSNDSECEKQCLFFKESKIKGTLHDDDNTSACDTISDYRCIDKDEVNNQPTEDLNANDFEISNNRNDGCEEDMRANYSDSDDPDNITKSNELKSNKEKFINDSCLWNDKCSFTKEHLDRASKSKKTQEQLETFFDYVCFDCEENVRFSNFLLLKNHCRDAHKKKAEVTCCRRRITERKALIHHMLSKHIQPDEFSCPECGKSVSTRHMLKLHIINHLPETERPFKCSQCGRGFCSVPYVRKHEKNHHFIDDPMGTFICEECGKSFIYERKLYNHKRNLHSKVENPVMCHICAKTFKHQSALRSHLMTHKQGRTEECPYCHKYFKNTDTVRSHIKQEHRVSPAHCEPCNKTFRSKRKLVCHTKVFHSNEKPHQCNICSRKFKLRSGLKTHMVQHTGEKPYQCPHCCRTFASSGNWSTHKKRMHGEIKSVSTYQPEKK